MVNLRETITHSSESQSGFGYSHLSGAVPGAFAKVSLSNMALLTGNHLGLLFQFCVAEVEVVWNMRVKLTH